MKRPLVVAAWLTLFCLAFTSAKSHASDGFPPKNLPDGSGWLPGPNATVAVPGFPLRAHERLKIHPGPYERYSPPARSPGLDVTPIPIPGPRSIGKSRAALPQLNRRFDAPMFQQTFPRPQSYRSHRPRR